MAAATDARRLSLSAGVGNSFDCENGRLSQHPIGRSELGQFKKYLALVAVTMAFGAFVGMVGFCSLGPVVSAKNGAIHGHGRGPTKAMPATITAEIEHIVDLMNDAELGMTFSYLQHEICDASLIPKVKPLLRDQRIKSRLDATIAKPRFPEEVSGIVQQSLEKGTVNPLASLGKFAAVAIPHRAAQPTKLTMPMTVARAALKACLQEGAEGTARDQNVEDLGGISEYIETGFPELDDEYAERVGTFKPKKAYDYTGMNDALEMSDLSAIGETFRRKPQMSENEVIEKFGLKELDKVSTPEMFLDVLDEKEQKIQQAEQASQVAMENLDKAPAPAAAVPTGDAPVPVSPNDVPRNAIIAVAGGGTSLGMQFFRALFAADKDFKLRALESGGARVDEAQQKMFSIESGPGESRAQIENALDGAAALVIISASAGGKGGVETDKVDSLLKAIPERNSLRRVIFVSSHGVERTSELPFILQNALGGQLDKLRFAEEEVILRAKASLPSFSIVRVGKLVGDGAQSNLVSSRRCEIAAGDALQGALPVTTASTVLLETITRVEAVNASFSIAPLSTTGMRVSDAVPDAVHWADEFLKLQGPEIYRRPLLGCQKTSSGDLMNWLREWVLGFAQPGSGLTTPVEIGDLEGAEQGVVTGVVLRFLKEPNAGYPKFDAEETTDQKWERFAKAKTMKSATYDGALYVVAEVTPYPRVRVVRAQMKEDVLVKPMSEATIIDSLGRAASVFEKEISVSEKRS